MKQSSKKQTASSMRAIPKISSIVLTHNNDRTIKQCISSIKDISDELIIIDDMSTDSTIENITKIFPRVKVFIRSLNRDFAGQRNFGIQKSKNEWILMIDSDEVLTDGLKKNLLIELQNPKHNAYRCKIKNYSFGRGSLNKLIRPIVFESNLRFVGRLHEQVKHADFGELRGYIDHFSWVDAEDWLNDMNTYSTNQAKKWISEGRRWSKVTIFFLGLGLPTFIFIKMFFWEGRWRRGFIAGLLYCLGCSAEHLFSLLKYYEIKVIKR